MEEIEVPWSKIKKGYEITKNDYVVIEKEDIDKSSLRRIIRWKLRRFSKPTSLILSLLKRTITLDQTQEKKKIEASTKAYSLLVKIPNETKKDSNRQSSNKRKRASGCFKSISKRS